MDKFSGLDWGRSKVVASIATALMVAVGFGVPKSAFSANSWFSKMRTEPEGNTYVNDASPAGVGKSTFVTSGDVIVFPQADMTSTLSIFDIVVSLYAKTGDDDYPDGDDDASVDAGASDDEQNAYEEIINHFADSICEQTNGAHHLGKVRIFKRGGQRNKADIVWAPAEHPKANPSGFGQNGKHIYMGDVFGSVNFLNSSEHDAAGYTLGHEWGHYTLGLFDEYVGSSATGPTWFPRSTDTPPANPAIMNSQWVAAQTRGGDMKALNHSQVENFSLQTAQGRVFGKSGWEVLAQSTDDDPKTGQAANAGILDRTHYTNLDSVGPAAAGAGNPPNYDLELPSERADCRSDLDIIWAKDDVELQLVIDRSGSMGGSPFSNAQQAAKTVVDLVKAGTTAMGVVSFSSRETQNQAITPIPLNPADAAVRTTIKNTIDGLRASGTTAIFDAATLALNNLQSYATTNSTSVPQVVFLLSDGSDNASTQTESSVVSAYQSADVPLNTFGYGSFAPTGTLLGLASGTGGIFSQSPTTLAEIQSAFNQALATTTNTVSVGVATPTASPSGTAALTFQVDDTLESLTLLATFNAAESAVPLSVATPGGSLTISFDCSVVGSDTTCAGTVDQTMISAQGTGEWVFSATNNTAGDEEVFLSVFASPKPGDVFDVSIASVTGNTVSYPQPIQVTAAVSKGLPITNVNLTATLTDPNNDTTSIVMNDNGALGDAVPNDGIYSAILPYALGGTHTIDVQVDNNAGTAQFTRNGASPSHTLAMTSHAFAPNPDGSQPTPPALPSISQNFSRTGTTQVLVSGFSGDDHSDSFSSATTLPDDNSDLNGNIDFAGDIDAFAIAPSDTSRDLTVRVSNLALDMNPVLTVLRGDATTVAATGTIRDAQTVNAYVSLTVPAASVDSIMFVSIEHADSLASRGTYSVSAGEAVASDQQVTAPTLQAAILPSSRSVQVGSTATAFLTIINGGATEAFNIRNALATAIPAGFLFQATDPHTNAIVGSLNGPVSIPPGGSQSFVIALTPTDEIASTEVEFGYEGFNSVQASKIPGVNTMFFSASNTPVPDIVALAATLNSDGIVTIPGASGTGVFAVATANVGVPGAITVNASTGSGSPPISVTICETDGVANCMAEPGATVTTSIAANATPTFGVFVEGSGQVNFDPAVNRVFLEFRDGTGELRGSTSVAVRTQ